MLLRWAKAYLNQPHRSRRVGITFSFSRASVCERRLQAVVRLGPETLVQPVGTTDAPPAFWDVSFHQTRAHRFWLTSESACVRTALGKVRPSALAVSGLATSSNCLGYSTGSSAGFLPFKILST